MNGPAFLIACALAAVLIVAGLEKLRAAAVFEETLSRLGLPGRLRGICRIGVPVAELAVGTGLLLAPARTWPLLGAGALGVVFALAGALALRAPQPVPCSCLGAAGGGTLGRRQILLLPVWGAGLYALWRWRPHWTFEEGMQYLAALVVLLGVTRAVPLVAEWRAAAGTRNAMQEAIDVRAPILIPGERPEGGTA